jgi:2-phospho-L-lactate guanylyltransferase (CobY/MobA/RfbA family)
MDNQVISSAIAVLGTLGGALIGVFAQREARKVRRLEVQVDRYRREIRARQAEEEVAAIWLSKCLVPAITPLAAKRELRNRTEKEKGVRPFIAPREVTGND